MLKRLRMLLRALFNRAGAETDLDDELRFHLEQQTQLYVRQGMSRGDAERKARLALGGVESTKETYRDGRGTRGFEEIIGDVRYAVRSLLRDRALTFAGVLTLALGVGATTAVFSAVNAVILRQLPFQQPDRLVSVWEENSDRGWYKNWVAPANYLDWRERASAFEGIAAYTDYGANVTLLGRGEPQLLTAEYATGNFLPVLGVTPQLGRGFEPADDWRNGRQPAMLSHRAWTTHFRRDSSIIGKSMSIGGQPWQIVGVLPEGFAFPSPNVDVWFPMDWPQTNRTLVFFRRAHWLRAVGRLKPGVSHDAANASLQTVVTQLQGEYPATNTRMGAGITPLHEWIVGNTKRPLVVLLSAAAVLLLIACANVGNLLLVHALGRSRDVALRFALGATRPRVVRQALTESLVLSTAGGLAGFGIGWAGARALLAMQPTGLLPVSDISVDYRVLAFAIALVAISGLLFGMAPAMIATRQAPADALNSGGSRTVSGGRMTRWGKHLVVAEVALAVMLTVGAGLLLRSYERLSRVEPGFDPTGVLTVSLSIPGVRYDSAPKVVRFYSALAERVQALPGVERVAIARQLPVTESSWTSDFNVAGRPPSERSQSVVHREVSGEYFRVMRIPLREGRTFTAADVRGAESVVVINDVMAKMHFPNESPVGQRIAFDRVPDSTSLWRTIVGVVGSERQGSLASPMLPEIFTPFSQVPQRSMVIVLRARPDRDAGSLAGPVRRAVREQDSLLAIRSIRAMTEVHASSMARERFTSVLVLVFAVTGVALALVGVFGVLAQLVQSRWREMGIRLALGAQRSQVRWLIVRYGATLLALGIGAGLLVALGATQVLAKLLFEIRPTDALTYAGVALLIGGVGMLAAWVPAWRASAANPATTLRAE